MSLRRNRSLLAGLLLIAGIAACGGGGGDDEAEATGPTGPTNPTTPFTGTLPPEADPTFCEPMRALANYNAETPTPDVTQDWATLQTQFAALQTESVSLYGDAIASAPADIRDDLETLRDYSDSVFAILAEATSVDDFVSRVGTPPQEVLDATGAINVYIQEACGFTLTETG